MHNDLAAIGGAHHIEQSLKSDPAAKNSSDVLLMQQMKESLQTSRSTGSPPRIDVVTATDKLQTLSQLFSDPRSSQAIETLLSAIQKTDPKALMKPGAIDQLIKQVMAPPIPIVAATPTPQISKSNNASQSELCKNPTRKQTTSSMISLSKRVKAFIKFIFG